MIFVAHVAKGVPRTKAARLAGFVAPAVEAFRLMKLPHVVDALHTRREAALKGDLASLAVETMRELMSPETPAATRYQAARWTLEHAGHVSSDDESSQATALEEMDADALGHAVMSGMQALQELAEQLEGYHVIDGQARRLQSIVTRASYEAEAGRDFLR